MKQVDWSLLCQVFESAAKLPDVERSAYLDQACAGDDSLRRVVVNMVESERGSSMFLHPVDSAGAVMAADQASAPTAGTGIGGYRIRRELASGGMGTVYEAEQQSPRRKVALKIMRVGLVTPEMARRFQYESEILAKLRHPNVAQVYDSGVHVEAGPNGPLRRPWFAMEFVEGGRDLMTYARELDLRSRLELFCEVCAAVHYGHQRGVIHRDLKPGNVLVDERGQPKLIDFGVARSTDADLVAATQLTQPGMLMGTLRYMSPEQLAGKPDEVDVRSDVYALGVMLYELLCGAGPHDIDGLSVPVAVRRLAEESPRSLRKLRPDLPADLEWICLRAIERDRDLRYPSALALADDLGRYMNYEPVQAGAPTTGYRLRKFVRRNRLLVGAAVCVLLALSIGTLLATMGLFEAREAAAAAQLQSKKAREADAAAQRESKKAREAAATAQLQSKKAHEAAAVAQRESKKSKNVSDYFIDVFTGTTPRAKGRDARVVDFLDQAVGDLDSRFADEPEQRLFMQNLLGVVYANLGLYDEAEQLLEDNVAQAVRRFGADDVAVANAHYALGNAYLEMGRYEDAEQHLAKEVEMLEQRYGPDHEATLDARRALATSISVQGRSEQAERVYLEVLPRLRRLLGDDDPKTINAITSLSTLYLGQGRLEEADALALEVITTAEQLDQGDRYYAAEARSLRGRVCQRQGLYEQAIGQFEQALAGALGVAGEDHHFTVTCMGRLAESCDKSGDPERAAELYGRMIAASVRGRSSVEEQTFARSELIGILMELGRLDEARTQYGAALVASLQHFGEAYFESEEQLQACVQQLAMPRGLGEPRQLLAQALDMLAEESPELLVDRLRLAALLARIHVRAGDFEDAATLQQQACRLAGQALPGDSAERGLHLAGLAATLAALERTDEALAALRDAHEIYRQSFGDEDGRTAELARRLEELRD